ncbi:amino acid transporter [Chiua virens]|nr:amino acid transporter [Chiua virens]
METPKDVDFTCETTDDNNVSLSAVHRADNSLLQKLGYKSEFKREFSLLETISFSLAIMAVSCGTTTGYSYPLLSGGHFAMVWGWFIPCIFITCVAASMAELASSMPTSAGLYYFSAKMASEKRSALASWITGWSNITGQVTLICSINYSCAELIVTGITMATDGAVVLSSGAFYGILCAIHLTQAVICSAGTRVLARMTVLVLILIMATTIPGAISLLVRSKGMVSPKAAFTMFENNTGWSNGKVFTLQARIRSSGIDGWAFILAFTMIRLLTIAEETSNAARTAPIAIMVGVLGTEILGWFLFISFSFATYSVPDVLQSKLAFPIGDVFLNVLGKNGAFALWWSIAGASVVFAFSRDNALPGSRWWKRVNPYTQTPVNAVCASVIGLYVSYVTPIYFRITSGKDKFKPGPFHLGRWSRPIGAIAVTWVVFMVVMLLFPSSQTVGPETTSKLTFTSTASSNNHTVEDYAVVIIMGIFLFSAGSWIFSAKHWFTGPVPNIDRESSSEDKPE